MHDLQNEIALRGNKVEVIFITVNIYIFTQELNTKTKYMYKHK